MKPLNLAMMLVLLWATMVSAQQEGGDRMSVDKIIAHGKLLANGIIERLQNSNVARDIVQRLMGGMHRQKRSPKAINSLDTGVMTYKSEKYQKIEFHRIFNKTRVGSYHLGQNEVRWLEAVTILMSHTLQDMIEVFNGTKINALVSNHPYIHN